MIKSEKQEIRTTKSVLSTRLLVGLSEQHADPLDGHAGVPHGAGVTAVPRGGVHTLHSRVTRVELTLKHTGAQRLSQGCAFDLFVYGGGGGLYSHRKPFAVESFLCSSNGDEWDRCV